MKEIMHRLFMWILHGISIIYISSDHNEKIWNVILVNLDQSMYFLYMFKIFLKMVYVIYQLSI